jgi:hypothetical protein
MTVVQLASLVVRTPAPYYVFFSVLEIAATVTIVWFAWRWRAAGDESHSASMAVPSVS